MHLTKSTGNAADVDHSRAPGTRSAAHVPTEDHELVGHGRVGCGGISRRVPVGAVVVGALRVERMSVTTAVNAGMGRPAALASASSQRRARRRCGRRSRALGGFGYVDAPRARWATVTVYGGLAGPVRRQNVDGLASLRSHRSALDRVDGQRELTLVDERSVVLIWVARSESRTALRWRTSPSWSGARATAPTRAAEEPRAESRAAAGNDDARSSRTSSAVQRLAGSYGPSQHEDAIGRLFFPGGVRGECAHHGDGDEEPADQRSTTDRRGDGDGQEVGEPRSSIRGGRARLRTGLRVRHGDPPGDAAASPLLLPAPACLVPRWPSFESIEREAKARRAL